uniref:Uncharacterized protein n=1 Tax=Elaeophora elaphi TaxID=1147741 RepID=A0A0R3RN42_9BILA
MYMYFRGSNRDEKDLLTFDVMPTTDPLNTTNLSGTSSRDLVDLEVIVLNWAKQIFDITKTKTEAKINKKFLQNKTFSNSSAFHFFDNLNK